LEELSRRILYSKNRCPTSLKRSAQIIEILYDLPLSTQPSFLERATKKYSGLAASKSDFTSSSEKTAIQKRVMICDDESDVLRVYRLALSSRYNVLTASSGEECLRKYSSEMRSGAKVDLLLLDYKLGDMPGDEVARRIKEMNGTKIILISAYEISPSFLSDLKQRNCITSFVKKPITMASLLFAVDRVLSE
jgi:CheY-like chemotaxis protein